MEAVKGHEIWGLGATAKFERVINTVFTKTSIENQYLSLLYRFGWVGLGLYIIMSITILHYFWKNRNVGYKINEKLSLNVMFLLCFISYYILMFTFAEIDEIYFIHSLLGIIFAINKIYERNPVMNLNR